MNSPTTQQTGQRSHRGNDRRGTDKLSSLTRYVRAGISSGLFAGIAGLVTAGRVRRAIGAGSGDRAAKQGMMAVFWIGVAMTQWGMNRSSRQTGPSSGAGASPLADAVSDIAGISAGSGEEPSEESTSIDVTELDPTPDVEDAGPDADSRGTDVDPDSTVEDVAAAEGVEQAADAEGMEGVDDAEGVTDLDETAGSDGADDGEA